MPSELITVIGYNFERGYFFQAPFIEVKDTTLVFLEDFVYIYLQYLLLPFTYICKR